MLFLSCSDPCTLRHRSLLYPYTNMDIVQTCQYPNQARAQTTGEKVLTIEKSATNLKLVLQQLVRNKRNEHRRKPFQASSRAARVLPLELESTVPKFALFEQQQKVVQTGARLRARASNLNGVLE